MIYLQNYKRREIRGTSTNNNHLILWYLLGLDTNRMWHG